MTNEYETSLAKLEGKTVVSAKPIFQEGDESFLQIDFSDGTYLRMALDHDEVDLVFHDSVDDLPCPDEGRYV